MAPTFLPNELWVDIITLLPRDDLPSLSITSKLFNQLAEPILYGELDTTKSGTGKAVECFLRTMIKRPELARHVKHATFKVMYDHRARSFTALDLSSFTWGDRAVMSSTPLDAVHDYKVSQNLLNRIVNTKSWDSIVAFLIAIISPSVEKITIENFGPARCPDICSILRVLAGQRGITDGSDPFPQLHEVQLLHTPRHRLGTLRNALPFLRLKTVAKFVFRGINGVSIPDAFDISEFSATSLELHNCQMTTKFLALFLGCFTSLRRLKWFTEYVYLSDGYEMNLSEDFPRLRAELEELIIDAASGSTELDMFQPRLTLNNVSNFIALRNLEVDSVSALGGSQMRFVLDSEGVAREDSRPYPWVRIEHFLATLPSSLECLKITACRHRIFDVVPEIVGLKHSRLLHLRVLKLGCKWNIFHPTSALLQSTVDACARLCSEASIEFTILKEQD